MTTRSSTCTGASRYTARPVTSGSRSRRAVSSSCVSTTWASATQPQRSGESTRRSRLATKTITATTPRIPSVVATSVDRTGTAVRPRPACSAMRVPTTVVGGAPRAARRAATAFVRSAGACRRRRDGPDDERDDDEQAGDDGQPEPEDRDVHVPARERLLVAPCSRAAPTRRARRRRASATTVPRATNGDSGEQPRGSDLARRHADRAHRRQDRDRRWRGSAGASPSRDAEEAGDARDTRERSAGRSFRTRAVDRDHRALAARHLHLDAVELLRTLGTGACASPISRTSRVNAGRPSVPSRSRTRTVGKALAFRPIDVSEGRGSVGVDRVDAAIDGAPSDADDPHVRSPGPSGLPNPVSNCPNSSVVRKAKSISLPTRNPVTWAAFSERTISSGLLGSAARPSTRMGVKQTSRPRLGQPEDPEVPAFAVDLGDARGRDHRRLDLGQVDDPPRLAPRPPASRRTASGAPDGLLQALVRGGRAARELDRADHESRRHPGEHAQEDHRAERLPELGACEQPDRGHPRHQRTAAHLLPGGQPVERGRAGLTEARRPTPPTAPPRRRRRRRSSGRSP